MVWCFSRRELVIQESETDLAPAVPSAELPKDCIEDRVNSGRGYRVGAQTPPPFLNFHQPLPTSCQALHWLSQKFLQKAQKLTWQLATDDLEEWSSPSAFGMGERGTIASLLKD